VGPCQGRFCGSSNTERGDDPRTGSNWPGKSIIRRWSASPLSARRFYRRRAAGTNRSGGRSNRYSGYQTEAKEFFKAPAVQAGTKALGKESSIDYTGRTVSHYAVVEKIAEGGLGVVYKARDTHLEGFVALKVLPVEKVADPERKRRFVQEAKAASALNHPNIVTIHDNDTADSVTFTAMEFVKGRTLDRLIRGKGIALNEALKYGVQIADALAAAHTAGIIHRDISRPISWSPTRAW